MAVRERAQRRADAAAHGEFRQRRHAWPVRPGRCGSGSRCPRARRAAIQRRIGCASKPNCVTSDTASPRCRASSNLACNAASSTADRSADGPRDSRRTPPRRCRGVRPRRWPADRERAVERPDGAAVVAAEQQTLASTPASPTTRRRKSLASVKLARLPRDDMRHRVRSRRAAAARRQRPYRDASRSADN